MTKLRTLLTSLAAAAALSLSLAVQAIPVTQIGFALDSSGSVSSANYNLMRNGLADALAGLPTDSTVEVTVISFSSGVRVHVAPTVIDSQATLNTVVNTVRTHTKVSGGTNTAGGINLLTQQMVSSENFLEDGTTSIINVATDGSPNSQSQAVTAASNANAAGIDAVSLEAIGRGVSSQTALDRMLEIANAGSGGGASILPVNSTNIPNPVDSSWVVPVSNFESFAAVVDAKVQAIVAPPTKVPEPSTWLLFSLGLTGLIVSGLRRKAA